MALTDPRPAAQQWGGDALMPGGETASAIHGGGGEQCALHLGPCPTRVEMKLGQVAGAGGGKNVGFDKFNLPILAGIQSNGIVL